MENCGLDEVIDLRSQGHFITPSEQTGSEAHGQVIGLHHVLIAVLRDTEHTHQTQVIAMRLACNQVWNDHKGLQGKETRTH